MNLHIPAVPYLSVSHPDGTYVRTRCGHLVSIAETAGPFLRPPELQLLCDQCLDAMGDGAYDGLSIAAHRLAREEAS